MATTGQLKEQSMSAADQAALKEAGDRYNAAKAAGDTAGMEAAHKDAENIRAGYGYSGDTNGAGYIEKSSPTTPGSTPDANNRNDLTPTTVYRNGRYINAFINNAGQTVGMNGGRFNFNNGDIVKTNGGYYIWENGKATPYTGALPDSESYSRTTITGNPDELYNVKNGLGDWKTQQDYINSQFNDIRKQLLAANDAGTELGVLQLQAQLENGLSDYDRQREQSAITQARAANNAALRSAAAGDLGGIGQKQYSAEQNAYDQQMLSIQLEQINFTNEINQQIAQLEAQGKYNEAQLLAEWGQQKVNMMQEQYDWYWNLREQNAYAIDYLNKQIESESYEREQNANELAYNRAMQRLQLGVFNADDAESLGIPADKAQELAQYYNTLAQVDLDTAKAQLAGYRGGGSGGGGGYTTDTGGKMPTKKNLASYDDAYAWLANNGVDPTNAPLYFSQMGFNQSEIEDLVLDYEDYLDRLYRTPYDSYLDMVPEDKKAEIYRKIMAGETGEVGILNPHDADQVQVADYGVVGYDELRQLVSQGIVQQRYIPSQNAYYYIRIR